MSQEVFDLAPGARVGRWTLETYIPGGHVKHANWVCQCDCGTKKAIDVWNLRYGKTLSCGCWKPWAINQARGLKRGPERGAWRNMLRRRLDASCATYKNYGARGITVHPAWVESFDAFVRDVGQRPDESFTLERVDNDGHYEPGNVRWATRMEQARNKRNSVYIEYGGRRMCLIAWAQELGVTSNHIARRRKKGMTPQQAIQDILDNPPRVRGPYRLKRKQPA